VVSRMNDFCLILCLAKELNVHSKALVPLISNSDGIELIFRRDIGIGPFRFY
jgi:hypothetical protein